MVIITGPGMDAVCNSVRNYWCIQVCTAAGILSEATNNIGTARAYELCMLIHW